MPNPSAKSIRKLCHRHIAALGELTVEPAQLEDWVVDLVKLNIGNGRFERFASGRTNRQSLDKYVKLVVFYAHLEYARIHGLEEGNQTEWSRLSEYLRRRSVSLVRRFHNERDTSEIALDFAQQACSNIFEARYPCDVPFGAWVTRILKNLITAHYTRSSDTLHRSHDSLDGPATTANDNTPTLGELTADPSSAAQFEKVENQSLLLDAIDQLRIGAQRQVIQWSYLEELADAEIARRLHKSTQAVYNLRQRALVRLSQILAETVQKKNQRKSIK